MFPALDRGRRELQGWSLPKSHDLFDRYSCFGPKSGSPAIAPYYASDDDMVAAAHLDLRARGDLSAGMNHEPARRDVEDAGIGPRSAVAKPRGHDHTATKLARLLRGPSRLHRISA